MNRLVTVSKSGQTSLSVTYDAAGNITSKSDVGTYNYEDGSNKLVSITNCKRRIAIWDDIVYNSFDKIINLRFSDKTMMLEYGPDKSRVFSAVQGVEWKYYVDNLFEQKMCWGKEYNINYIFAFGKAVAIVTEGENTDIKYVLHDHLGSIQAYTDESGLLYQDLSYDAWGLRRSPDNGKYLRISHQAMLMTNMDLEDMNISTCLTWLTWMVECMTL